MKRCVELQFPGAAPERHELDSDRCWVNRADRAEWVRREPSLVEPALVEVFPRDDGVWVEVGETSAQSVVFEGQPYREVLVPWAGEIYFGSARLTFLQEDEDHRRPSPVLWLALVAAVGFAGFGAVGRLATADPSTREVAAPALATTRPLCANPDPKAAAHRAEEAERFARAKEQRFVFDTTDGVDAMALLGEACVCFEAAGRADDRARAAAELDRWTGRMNEQYTELRLRLRVAVDHHEYPAALRAVRELQTMVSGSADGPYAQWLVELRRDLENKVAQSGA